MIVFSTAYIPGQISTLLCALILGLIVSFLKIKLQESLLDFVLIKGLPNRKYLKALLSAASRLLPAGESGGAASCYTGVSSGILPAMRTGLCEIQRDCISPVPSSMTLP